MIRAWQSSFVSILLSLFLGESLRLFLSHARGGLCWLSLLPHLHFSPLTALPCGWEANHWTASPRVSSWLALTSMQLLGDSVWKSEGRMKEQLGVFSYLFPAWVMLVRRVPLTYWAASPYLHRASGLNFLSLSLSPVGGPAGTSLEILP